MAERYFISACRSHRKGWTMATDRIVFLSSTTTTPFATRFACLWSSPATRSRRSTSAGAFLASDALAGRGCLITDIRMPDMDGLELQEELVRRNAPLPVIVITGHGDVPLAVRAMKAGAVDFLGEAIRA